MTEWWCYCYSSFGDIISWWRQWRSRSRPKYNWLTMKDDRENSGKGLMHAEGYTMTKIVVLTKVVLITIIPNLLVLLLLMLLGRCIIISGIISKTTIATNRWHKNKDEDNDNWNTMDITNNNKNNNNAEWGLMHPEGLYDDEDCSTDEGVLIRIKLRLCWLLFLLVWWW